MDLLFKRYANPFLLLDEMINNYQFDELVTSIIEKNNDDKIYDIWLHKVFTKTYEEFYKSCFTDETYQKVDVDEVIKESTDVLNIITPQGGE